ncbi:MAG: MFS transporter [Actinobacteria bacterium]|nr:MFS transporter [Actinomycetota bacterium]
MNIFKDYFKLPRSIYILFFARIINMVGGFVYPLLAILLTQKLGFDERTAGIITTVSVAVGAIGVLIGGKLADKVGRKKLIVVSSLLGAAVFLVCAFLGTSRIIVYFIMAGNLISVMQWPTLDAMVTDCTDKSNRQTAFSLLYMGLNIGVAIGPLMAGFLIEKHLFWFFAIDGITTIISMIPVVLFVKDTTPTEKEIEAVPETDTESAEKASLFKALLKRPVLLFFMFILMLFTFVYSQYSFGLPLFATDVFGNGGAKMYGIVMSVNAVLVVLLTLLIISVTKRLKPLLSIAIGGFLYAAGFGILYFSTFLYLFIISTVIWTVGEIIITVNMEVYIANNAPITHRGRFFASINFLTDVGYAISPMLTGFFIAKHGTRNIWPVVSLVASLAAFCMLILFFYERARLEKAAMEGSINR